MSVAEMKQKLEKIIEILPESKLETILEFSTYLKEREQKAMIHKANQGIANRTFGAWSDEIDGIEYMDKVRVQWERK